MAQKEVASSHIDSCEVEIKWANLMDIKIDRTIANDTGATITTDKIIIIMLIR